MERLVVEGSTEAGASGRSFPASWPAARHLLGGAIVLSAVGGALADGEPTGLAWWDLVLRAILAGSTAAAGALAPWWARALAAGVGAALAQDWSWQATAGAGLALALVTGVRRLPADDDRLLGAAAAGLGVQALLRMGDVGFFGLPSLLAAATIFPVLLLGRARAGNGFRQAIRVVGFGVGGLLLLLLGLTAAGGLWVRGDALAGARAARAGLEAARDGDQDRAVTRLREAEERLATVDDRAGSWWFQPARLLPVAGQHVEATAELASLGARVGAAAAEAAVSADLDELRTSRGEVDLDQLAGMREPLDRVLAAVEDAIAGIDEVDSGWLIPPFEDRMDELADELVAVEPETRTAAMAATVVPDILGADGPRRYLALFATPAEARELGGLVSNVIELEIVDGTITVGETLRNTDLTPSSLEPGDEALLSDPDSYPARYLTYHPGLFSQNLSAMTDFPSVARAVADLYPRLGGTDLDGVLYLDPYAVAALLQVTGPIELPDLDRPLNAGNIVDFLLSGQYAEFPLKAARVGFLGDVSTATFDQLLRSELPSPRRLGDIFGPSARGGHLAFVTFDEAENAFLDRVFLTSRFPAAPADDVMAVVHTNASPSKLDSYLTKTIDYRIDVDTDMGTVAGTVTVRLTNQAPDDLPDYVLGDSLASGAPGTNTTFLSLYTGLEATVTLDGEPLQPETATEFGLTRYGVFVPIGRGDTVELVFTVSGGVRLDDAQYSLALPHQATVNAERIHAEVSFDGAARVRAAQGFEELSDDRVVADLTLVEDLLLTVDL